MLSVAAAGADHDHHGKLDPASFPSTAAQLVALMGLALERGHAWLMDDLPEFAAVVVVHRLDDLLLAVHDEGAVTHDRFVERLTV